jgi:two-component system sensor histidine kinase GlrK
MREGTALLADEVVGTLTPDQQEVVSILDQSSRHLQRLIEQLLDYNRKLSEAPVAMGEVQLEPLINGIVSSHSLTARAKMMQTEVTLPIAACRADATLLARAIDNLYSNAIHYGGESGTIWIRSRQQGRKVLIEVANTGSTIPEGERKMIFEPFFQGNQQRKGAVKGSGLGLSIARDCIHRLQGDLQLVNSEAEEVCFRIELNAIVGNAQ